MARKPGSSPSAIKSRAAKTAAALAPAGGASNAAKTAAPAAPKKPFNPMRFAQEVRAEARKITWTTRKETWITSVMVFIMVVISALFFTFADWILGMGANLLLKFAAG
ncbi:MAG: preprotein translocase subunit SecE [Gemmatimonadaceae bacterium]|uniref:preprotein translocase subunit SecE n=1 Tax=Caulobacter sp. DWP3-1-3b2 TaxID=2804643 RepID=UPI0019CBB223|nr:preprotein translocase subunit SecE [Caulobacter sp.]